MKLSEIKSGQKAIITSVDTAFVLARRLIEMGFSEGTEVMAVIKGMSSKLTAYSVKSTLIALRDETAQNIKVHLKEGD